MRRIRDKLKGLSANLGATHSKLEAELAKKQRRAQARETDIVHLREALEYQRSTLVTFSARLGNL
jgi:hypothetical protein